MTDIIECAEAKYIGKHRLSKNWEWRQPYGVPCTWWEFSRPPFRINCV